MSQSSGSSYQEQEVMTAGALAPDSPITAHPNSHLREDGVASKEVEPQQYVLETTQAPASTDVQSQEQFTLRESGVLAAPIVAGSAVPKHDSIVSTAGAPGDTRAQLPVDIIAARSNTPAADRRSITASTSSSLAPSDPGAALHAGLADAKQTSGGKEKEEWPGNGLHPTGRIFPSVLRHDTEMSAGQLHIPGEWKTEEY